MSFRLFFWIIDYRGGLCSARRIITDWTTCQDRDIDHNGFFARHPSKVGKGRLEFGVFYSDCCVLTSTVIANWETDRLCQYLGLFEIEQFLFNIIFKSN